MPKIAILERKCISCGSCVSACPFGGMELVEGKPQTTAACRLCGLCVKACPEKAILKLETREQSVDKSLWRDILVFCEVTSSRLHPVVSELLGEARRLAAPLGWRVLACLVGSHVSSLAPELIARGADEVSIYDDPELVYFRAEAFADCMAEDIRLRHPSVVLVGATSLGRSLAPRLATRFHTGLTADCTKLELRENSDLVQIRPAFGGNIMAQIITTHSRPQFATVRYKVMSALPVEEGREGTVLPRKLPAGVKKLSSQLVSRMPLPPAKSISDAEILVVGGRGLRKEEDLSLIRRLAELLGGDWATSRPLVEKGWSTGDRQVGLSGRTVRPRLIITCGVSGAIQFTSCMKGSDTIVAINQDPNAPIFDVAHIAVVGDLYEILPQLIHRLEEDLAKKGDNEL